MESRREIRRALEYAGWEVRWSASTDEDPEVVVGGYGPYRLVVRFDADRGPTSVLTHRVGSQGIFTERWRGTERLPAPEEVVRHLSERDTGRPLTDQPDPSAGQS